MILKMTVKLASLLNMGGGFQRLRQSISKYEILMGRVSAHGNQGKMGGASEGLVLGFQIGRRLTDWAGTL